MKTIAVMVAIFITIVVAFFFYLDQEKQAEATKAEEEQKMSALCPETQPGHKQENMKAMNKACRAQGYID
jgi:uncharacterized membrane protein YebE (DUF533 family)